MNTQPQKPQRQSQTQASAQTRNRVYNMILNDEDYKCLIYEMFLDAAKFKQPGFESQEKKLEYLNKQLKNVITYWLLDTKTPDANCAQFDQFNLLFFQWLDDEKTKFPIVKEDFMKFRRDKTEVEKNQLKENQKLEKQQQDKQQQLARQQQQERLQQQQQQVQRSPQQPVTSVSGSKMVDETEQRSLSKSPNQLRPPPTNIQPSTQKNPSPMHDNRTANHLATGTIPAQKVQSRSPIQGNTQRTGQLQHRQIYAKSELPRQELIRKILFKICDCLEYPQRRQRPYAEAKNQLENLRRLQENEKYSDKKYTR